jgi:DNA mismatch repair protein MutL
MARMKIRQLPPVVVNRIAAGEVVERPAAAVKELVENAIDAGARHIEVVLHDGGQALIAVADDGSGMNRDELELAVERHCTSKLPDDDLIEIKSLGFRGEALPSIGAVSRLRIVSRPAHGVEGADTAWEIRVEGGEKHRPAPAAWPCGTRVEVRDLFFATPARLKFMKTPRSERDQALDAVKRLAMSCPQIGFTVIGDEERVLLRLTAAASREARLGALLGRDFAENSVPVAAARDGFALTGLIGLPTLNRGLPRDQYLVVNGRPVRDKLLVGAVRGAYRDVLARDRHPVVALFLDGPPAEIDVNVHPAKAEIRFRDAGLVRGLIVGALRHALDAAGQRASTTVATAALAAFRPGDGVPPLGAAPRFAFPPSRPPAALAEAGNAFLAPHAAADEPARPAGEAEAPLGNARAQLHGTYILAETESGIVLVDQHAAHERLVYERMKEALARHGVARQALLLPEIVELDPALAVRLAARADELAEFGLVVEPFGPGAVIVREVPALVPGLDVGALVRDLADELAEWGDALALKERVESVCGTLACHSSVRAGRRLSPSEMDALLRQMEATPNSGQCNHGRPTYVTLALGDIERLFGRR